MEALRVTGPNITIPNRFRSALIDAYADYDMFESVNTRVVAIVDGFRAAIELPRARGLVQLKTVLKDAVSRVEAVGSRRGYALVSAKEKESELVFLLAINDTQKGICALRLRRDTGDPQRDLLPIADMGLDADCSIVESFEWGGARRKVDVRVSAEITF
jgi:ribosome maturation protein Sdo1